jgi:hypothetical protein
MPCEDPWDTFLFRSTLISDVTTRSKREQQHEQGRPAAHRGRRHVSVSEPKGLGIGGGEEC